jgi:RNA polymerase sigma factor (sigma-70 family)
LQRNLSDADAEEIVGQCFAQLSSEMSRFEFRPTRGKFKTWLKQLVNNKITNLLAKRHREGLVPNSDLDARTAMAPDALWDRTWKQEVLNYCVQQARVRVSTRNYQIFRLSVYEGWAAGQIGESLGLKPEQVHRAKQRVLKAVREEMTKYLES